MRHWRIGIIILLALVLRLREFRQPLTDVFSWRQASTAMMADNFFHKSWNIFYPEVSWTGAEPGYQGREFQTVSYLAAIGYKVFGQKDWIGRGISICFGVWGVFALYQLIRRVWDENRALACALMMAILPGAIFIDRSFLPDPAMLALTTTAMWMLLTHLQTESKKYLALFGVFACWAMLTKPPAAVMIAPMIFVCVINARRIWPIALTFVVALLPVAAYYAWVVHLAKISPSNHIAGASNWVWRDGFGEWMTHGYYLGEIWKFLWDWFWTAPIVLLIGVGIFTSRGAGARMFGWWLAGCLLFVAIGARELAENPWNLHVFNLFAAVMAGSGAVWMAEKLSTSWQPILRTATAAIVLIALLFQGQVALNRMYRPGHAMNSYRLGRAIQQHAGPNDLVVTMADDIGDPIAIYYSHRRGWVFPPAHLPQIWPTWNTLPADDNLSIKMFEDLRGRGAKWLGIVINPKDDTPGRREFWTNHPKVVRHFNRTCQIVEQSPFWVLYRIDSPEEVARLGLEE